MATLLRRAEHPSPNEMTLFEHLAELRRRLIVCVIVFVVGAIVTYTVFGHIVHFLVEPLCHADPKHCTLYYTSPLEGFAVRLDTAGYGGLVVALPVILYQLWKFVTPGLKANEKKYALPFVLSMILLFAGGATVAWVTFPHALGFLTSAATNNLKALLTYQKYFQLLTALIVIFGLTFEFPVVLVALELAGVLNPRQLARVRRFAIVIIVIVSAVITPSSDPFSMLALAIPLLVFYEASILIGRLLKK